MNTLNIDKEKVINTYKQGSEKEKKVLELLFGVETFRPENVIERVKTFEDACRELGKDHPFVLAYQNTNLRDPEVADDNIEVIAYLKLRVITAALNEGWKPKPIGEERQYFPYFRLYFCEDISQMSKEEENRVVNLPNCGVSYSHAYYCFSSINNGSFGASLVFKTKELAEYAGKQFTKLYVDYLLNTNNA